ncbi:hypothetical protein [Kribbella speibonae]|uniref:Uncharacterized protein n=1 Tax=Kribbella speibonae TaxID=1572660 RepID=A0A4R0IC31_9ACTN|nr:hypothetical protein [Kribbella speibonae]TCC30681.1 hypothetical protein E0H92_36770 [Kribbella speibonae]
MTELDRLAAFSGPWRRTQQLAAIFRLLDAIDSALGFVGRTGDEPAPRSPVQEYFRIRTADVSVEVGTAHMIGVLTQSVGDLRDAPVSGAMLLREAAAIRQVLADLGGEPAVGVAEADIADIFLERPNDVDRRRWYGRWIIAHQLHALLNLSAAGAVESAVDALDEGDCAASVGHLRRAVVYVEGFTPARAHALAVPAWFYNDVLRPSMAPPLSTAPLSGAMHLEYKSYRRQVSRLLAALPEDIRELAKDEPELALMREALLEADLMDAENHVCLIEPVVGSTKSLVQSAKSSGSAVTMLRRIRDRRAASFEPYLRGDNRGRLTGTASHPSR